MTDTPQEDTGADTRISRATYLLVSDINKLSIFGGELKRMFPAEGVYGSFLVGSALEKPEYRDVDVRTIFSDDAFKKLEKVIDIGAINHLVSVWGQQLTGLPIDYQVMAASHPDNKGKKHPIDMFSGYVNGRRDVN